MKVALFVTCLVDQIMPEVGVATVKVLRRAGYDVDFPQAQTCCGQPFFNSGFHAEAAKLAKRTIEILEPYEAVVLPSGSCTTMIRAEYPHLLEHEPTWHERAKKVGEKTFELSEFLAKHKVMSNWVISNYQLPNYSITYHDSCHMCRMLNLRNEPREALTRAGCEIAEMNESDRCCGFGGLFSMRMPEVSRAMTADKLRRAAETGAETLVTADPGCLMQMRRVQGSGEVGERRRDGEKEKGIELKHLAVLLEELTR
ncbi:MAG: lactate utilization iron-sulfur protein LutA [Anaerolineales bacterium]